jgi:hypothetical protein
VDDATSVFKADALSRSATLPNHSPGRFKTKPSFLECGLQLVSLAIRDIILNIALARSVSDEHSPGANEFSAAFLEYVVASLV